eukprot:EG_transcript_11216
MDSYPSPSTSDDLAGPRRSASISHVSVDLSRGVSEMVPRPAVVSTEYRAASGPERGGSFLSSAHPLPEASAGLEFGRNTSWRWMQGYGAGKAPALSAQEAAVIRQLVVDGNALPNQHGPHADIDGRLSIPTSLEERYQAPLTEAEVQRLRASYAARGGEVRQESHSDPDSAPGSAAGFDRRSSAPVPPRPVLPPPRLVSSGADRPPPVPPNSVQSPKVGSIRTRVPGFDMSPTTAIATSVLDGSFAPTRANTSVGSGAPAGAYRAVSSGYFAHPPPRIVSVVSEYSGGSLPSRNVSEATSPLHGGSALHTRVAAGGPPSFSEPVGIGGGQWGGVGAVEVLVRPSSLQAPLPYQPARLSPDGAGGGPPAPLDHVFTSFGYPSTPRVSRGAAPLPYDVLPSPANSRARVSRTYATELAGHRRKQSEGNA